MANSEHCLSQARLIALQLSVLGNGKQVLNLDSRMVQKFMEEQPFIEVSSLCDRERRMTNISVYTCIVAYTFQHNSSGLVNN